mgnify:CR=1 FL=1
MKISKSMKKFIESMEEYVEIPTLDGNTHVVPLSCLEGIVKGDKIHPDMMIVIRSILAMWLQMLLKQIAEDLNNDY